MIYKFLFPALALTVLAAGGCRKRPDASPSARNQLVIRFFQSLERGDHSAAAEQAAKLKALDSSNEYLARVIDLQKANQIVKTAQDLLDAGRFGDAAQTLEQGMRQMPLEDHIDESLDRLKRAMALESAFQSYAGATDLNSRRQALEKLEALAAELKNEKLTAAVQIQRDIYTRQLAAETARLRAEAEAEAEAEAKAAKAEAARPETPAKPEALPLQQ